MRPKWPSCRGWALGLALLVLAGCGKELPSVDDVKQAVTNRVEGVKQSTSFAGSIELEVDKPIKAAGCYGRLYPQGAGRSAVLQITSYNDPSAESFPSVFIRARVDANAIDQLNGRRVAVKVFVQPDPSGPLWESKEEEDANLTLSAVENGTFIGELKGNLINSKTGLPSKVTGKLNGSLKSD